MENMITVTSETIGTCKDGMEVQITVALKEGSRKVTKHGIEMATAVIESASGPVDVIIFPDAYQEAKALIKEGAVVTIKGQIDDGRPETALKIKALHILG